MLSWNLSLFEGSAGLKAKGCRCYSWSWANSTNSGNTPCCFRNQRTKCDRERAIFTISSQKLHLWFAFVGTLEDCPSWHRCYSFAGWRSQLTSRQRQSAQVNKENRAPWGQPNRLLRGFHARLTEFPFMKPSLRFWSWETWGPASVIYESYSPRPWKPATCRFCCTYVKSSI